MRTRQQRFLDEDTHQARCRWMRCGPGLFHNCCLCTTALFLADNPAATAVIRSLILLGARRDGRDLSQDCDLLRDATASHNSCLPTALWPASRFTSRACENSGSS